MKMAHEEEEEDEEEGENEDEDRAETMNVPNFRLILFVEDEIDRLRLSLTSHT
jgi:hypothetical protein